MQRFTEVIHINAEPKEVFDYAVDPATVGRGMTVRPVYETAEGVGNVYEWTFRVLGVPFTGVMIYTEYEPDRRLVFRNVGSVETDTAWNIDPEPGGTRLTIEATVHVNVPLLGRFVEPLMLRQFRSELRQHAAALEEARGVVGATA